MKKSSVFIIFLLIAAFFLGYFWFSSKEQQITTGQPRITPTQKQSINITPAPIVIPTSLVPQKAPTTIDANKAKTITTPNELPIFAATNQELSEQETMVIAKNLSFSGSFQKESAPETTYFIWGTPGQPQLSINSKKRSFFYERPFPSSLLPPGENLSPIALDFIKKLSSNVPPSITIKTGKTTYFQSILANLQLVKDRTKANTAIVSLQYTINNVPFFLSQGIYEDINITIKNNEVYEASIKLPPTIKQTKTVPLISSSDAGKLLEGGGGALVNIQPETIGETTKVNPVLSASVDNVTLVYFYDTVNSIVRPAYLFSGIGLDKGNGESMVFFLVSATASF